MPWLASENEAANRWMDGHTAKKVQRKHGCESSAAAVDLPKLWQRRRGVHGRSRFPIAFILRAVVVIHLDGGLGNSIDLILLSSFSVYACITSS
jgi:hypothetical protein